MKDTTTIQDREIPLDAIEPNPWNAAKRVADESMVNTIKAHGLLQPVTLRPMPGKPGKFQIVFGERRFDGCKKAGRETITAHVRELDDREVQEFMEIENAQREPIKLLEHAKLIGRMLEKLVAEDVAANLGLSVGVVRRRAQILKLTPKWKKAMETEDFATWTAAHYERIAARPAAIQDDLLDEEFEFSNLEVTLEDLDRVLAAHMHDLKAAPWDLEDETIFPKAGKCSACPKRTGFNSDLFDEPDSKVKAGDRCLDNQCFAAKAQAYQEARATALKEEHGQVIKLSAINYAVPDGAVGDEQVKIVGAKTKGAVAAIYVDGDKAGKEVFVKLAEGQEVKAEGGVKKSMKERREGLEKRRRSHVLAALVDYVQATDLEWPAEDREMMVCLMFVFGTDESAAWQKRAKDSGWSAFHAAMKKKPDVESLWPRVRGRLVDQLRGAINQDAKLDEAVEIAKLVGADITGMIRQAESDIPTPKSWGEE